MTVNIRTDQKPLALDFEALSKNFNMVNTESEFFVSPSNLMWLKPESMI